VAFIGGGITSAVGRAHFNALQLDGLYRVVAGSFSRDPEHNRASAAAYGVAPEHTYADYRAMLDAKRAVLDAVIVLTPTSQHAEPVIAALEAGLPVICEKALATDLHELDVIDVALQRTGGFLAVTYNYTGYPALRELRTMIRHGALGRILHFNAEMPQEGFIRRDTTGQPIRPQSWRLRDGVVPTVYLDLAVHLHQITHYLMAGEPSTVSASQRSFGNFSDVVDYVSAQTSYADGVVGRFYFGKSMLGYRNGLRIQVFGSDASVEWEQTAPEALRVARADGTIQLVDRGAGTTTFQEQRYTRFKAGHPAGFIEAFANLYVDIHAALLQHRDEGRWHSDEVFGLPLVAQGLEFLTAMAQAARTETSVAVPRVAHRSTRNEHADESRG
jgi:predicted dehydrogenase